MIRDWRNRPRQLVQYLSAFSAKLRSDGFEGLLLLADEKVNCERLSLSEKERFQSRLQESTLRYSSKNYPSSNCPRLLLQPIVETPLNMETSPLTAGYKGAIA